MQPLWQSSIHCESTTMIAHRHFLIPQHTNFIKRSVKCTFERFQFSLKFAFWTTVPCEPSKNWKILTWRLCIQKSEDAKLGIELWLPMHSMFFLLTIWNSTTICNYGFLHFMLPTWNVKILCCQHYMDSYILCWQHKM